MAIKTFTEVSTEIAETVDVSRSTVQKVLRAAFAIIKAESVKDQGDTVRLFPSVSFKFRHNVASERKSPLTNNKPVAVPARNQMVCRVVHKLD